MIGRCSIRPVSARLLVVGGGICGVKQRYCPAPTRINEPSQHMVGLSITKRIVSEVPMHAIGDPKDRGGTLDTIC